MAGQTSKEGPTQPQASHNTQDILEVTERAFLMLICAVVTALCPGNLGDSPTPSHSLALIVVGTEAKPLDLPKATTNLGATCFAQESCHQWSYDGVDHILCGPNTSFPSLGNQEERHVPASTSQPRKHGHPRGCLTCLSPAHKAAISPSTQCNFKTQLQGTNQPTHATGS